MTKNKLVVACLAALSAFAMTGCGDPKCDPECGAGYSCNTKVDPPACEAVSPCNPACAAGQTCDTTKNPPVCVTPSTSCSPSCGSGYHCDASGAAPTCIANTCTPECGANQRCDTKTNPGRCVDKVPCDPGCGAGLTCNPTANNGAGACECSPACGQGQVCDLTQVPATCKNVCNPPQGCGELEVCNTTSMQCEPVTCGSTQCQQGEGCFNPTTGAAGNTCTCLPEGKPTSASEDTCLQYDMVCDYDPKAPRASHCKLPGEWDTCNPNATTPCETGLDCVDYTGQGSSYYCMVPCTTNADCGDFTGSYCAPEGQYGAGHCDDNLCSIPELWAGQGGKTEAQWREEFFKKCPVNDAAETNDPATWKGTCVPYPYNYNGRLISLGICEEAGNVASGGECDPSAGRSNMNAVCGFSTTCIGFQPKNATHTGGGVCMPDCNAAANPIPANTCTGFCMDYSGVEDDTFDKTRWGFCNDGCDPLAATACTDDVLGNNRGCTLNGFCWPVTETAAAINAACSDNTVQGDYRDVCADRSVCIPVDSTTTAATKCFGFCNPTVCPVNTVCEACGAGLNLYCADVGAEGLGVCYPTATME